MELQHQTTEVYDETYHPRPPTSYRTRGKNVPRYGIGGYLAQEETVPWNGALLVLGLVPPSPLVWKRPLSMVRRQNRASPRALERHLTTRNCLRRPLDKPSVQQQHHVVGPRLGRQRWTARAIIAISLNLPKKTRGPLDVQGMVVDVLVENRYPEKPQ